jgi:hypothetical protein
VVLYRGSWVAGPDDSFEDKQHHARAAYKNAQVKFGDVTGGAHAVTKGVMLRLIGAMNMTPGARTWEIGCGLPALAAAISAATSHDVLCTDIDDTYEYICNVATTEMRLRDLAANKRCFELANKLSWEELACLRNNKDKYAPDGPKLLSVIKGKFAKDPVLQNVEKLGKEADRLMPQKQRRLTTKGKERSVEEGWTQSPEREVKVLKVVGEAKKSTEDGDSITEERARKIIRIEDDEDSGSSDEDSSSSGEGSGTGSGTDSDGIGTGRGGSGKGSGGGRGKRSGGSGTDSDGIGTGRGGSGKGSGGSGKGSGGSRGKRSGGSGKCSGGSGKGSGGTGKGSGGSRGKRSGGSRGKGCTDSGEESEYGKGFYDSLS